MQIKIPQRKYHEGSYAGITRVRESTRQIPHCTRTLVGHIPKLSGSLSAALDAWQCLHSSGLPY